MRFTFESVDSCLQSAQHSCKKVWQEPTVDSFGDANAFLKKCVFVLKQVQHQLLQYVFFFKMSFQRVQLFYENYVLF
jgi:hypothetical protein